MPLPTFAQLNICSTDFISCVYFSTIWLPLSYLYVLVGAQLWCTRYHGFNQTPSRFGHEIDSIYDTVLANTFSLIRKSSIVAHSFSVFVQQGRHFPGWGSLAGRIEQNYLCTFYFFNSTTQYWVDSRWVLGLALAAAGHVGQAEGYLHGKAIWKNDDGNLFYMA